MVVYVPTEFSEKVKNALFEMGAGNIGFYDECSFSIKGTELSDQWKALIRFQGTQNVRENAMMKK